MHLGWHNRKLGAEPHRVRRRHGRPHPVGPRIVVTGRQHAAPLCTASDRHRNPAQFRPVSHFDGRIKAVGIDVDDFALHGERVQRDPGSGTPHLADTAGHQDLSLFTEKPATLPLCLSEGDLMKPGVIFGVVLIIIIGGIVVSHQLSESGNDHFDKAGENWKQN